MLLSRKEINIFLAFFEGRRFEKISIDWIFSCQNDRNFPIPSYKIGESYIENVLSMIYYFKYLIVIYLGHSCNQVITTVVQNEKRPFISLQK